MNGTHGGSLWQEAQAPDSRTYYYNTQTKETTWTKPPEMLTSVDRALASQPWKEHTAPDGRKYYAHAQTRQTVWDMPAEYREALNAAKPQEPSTPSLPTPTSAFPQPQANALTTYQPYRDSPGGYEPRKETIALPPINKEAIPDYSSFEEAEAAFLKLLSRFKVQADWSWEHAMRTTIKDPQFRALKDPKDRKAAFEKYTVDVREQEKEKAKERLSKLRSDFSNMLKTHPEIKHYSRWQTVRPIIEGETVFRSTDNEEERKQFFADYIMELKKLHIEQETAAKKSAMDDLIAILRALNLEPYTKWSEAQDKLNSNERMQSDERFKLLTKSDVLIAFENHIKSLERTFNDARQFQKSLKTRRERQHRDAFVDLLNEKRSEGLIKAGTKWKTILPQLENDQRYVAVLGQPGSTPLDLFWDVLEEEERELRGKRNDVYDVLEDQRFEITPDTDFDQFNDIMLKDRRTAGIDKDILQLILTRLQDKVLKRSEDEKHAADKHRRRAIDALRSRIKHLEPPVRITDTWNDVQPCVESSEEYLALETDQDRQAAFDKVIRRLKEKEEDAEKDRERRKARRADDRDYRNGHRDSRHSRSSKTPEIDAYEADRRKAMAAREKQYRKTSMGLSPPTSYRDRRDRDDRHGRLERTPPPRLSGYDRDQRDREDQRERLYRTRADPRSSRDELNYGEEARSVTSTGERRRRRDSPDPSVDENRRKRTRRESQDSRVKGRSRSPETKPEAVEAAGVHSGSEEGEIEED